MRRNDMEKTINTDKLETNKERYKEELDRLIDKYNGFVTPAEIVKEAKNKDNPLHGWFDWDNNIASEKWRMHQARVLIGTIKISLNNNLTEKEYRRYLNVTIADESGEMKKVYMSTNQVLNNQELKKQIIAKALICF